MVSRKPRKFKNLSRELIEKTYNELGKNVGKTAKYFKMSRRYIYNIFKKYNIKTKSELKDDIVIESNKNIGYICGFLMGDGYLYNKPGNISFNTTKENDAFFFEDLIKQTFPNLNPRIYNRWQSRKFPNGTYKRDICYNVVFSFPKLYKILRNAKKSDYHWKIPSFLNNLEGQTGFLQGIFDAEGGIASAKRTCTLYLFSKHKDNLIQIKELLTNLGIHPHISKHNTCFGLYMYNKKDKEKFYKLINFRVNKKKEKLKQDLEKYKTNFWLNEEKKYLIKNCNNLRHKEIAMKLNRSLSSVMNMIHRMKICGRY